MTNTWAHQVEVKSSTYNLHSSQGEIRQINTCGTLISDAMETSDDSLPSGLVQCERL
jgi:hypothetical protein